MDKDLLAEGYKKMAEKEQLIEDLKSCRNLIDICLILLKEERDDILATPLELLFEKIQEIVDTRCVVKLPEDSL